jgi:cytoskeletal protein CcmA (bactofilin family)
MFGKAQGETAENPGDLVQQLSRAPVRNSAARDATEATASISSGMTITGKVDCDGTVKVFGRIDGELHGSTIVIAEGAQMEGGHRRRRIDHRWSR